MSADGGYGSSNLKYFLLGGLILTVIFITSIANANFKFNYGDRVVVKNCEPSKNFYNVCPLVGKIVEYTVLKGKTNYAVLWTIETPELITSMTLIYLESELQKVEEK